VVRRAVGLLLLLAAVPLGACTAGDDAGEEIATAPAECLDAADATRDGVEGTPVWARFCPGPERYTVPAEVPSDALTTHLDLLDGLEERDAQATSAGRPCGEASPGRTYELQVGYADGGVATISGDTDPECAGTLGGGGAVGGPDGLGVYGLAMTAFGRQYADTFEDATGTDPLVCPDVPGDPDSVSVDGPSASVDTGYLMGGRSPMVMPLTAVRGIACTWPYGAEEAEPDVRALTPEEADRVRIGLHAIYGGMVDCEGTPEPTHTAVVEDRTGTRRAVTIQDWICSTVIRSDAGLYGSGLGLGFPWLDR
jgi:hypothetical protein